MNHTALSAQGTGPALLAVLSINRAVAESQLPLWDIPYFGQQRSPLLASAVLCSAEGAELTSPACTGQQWRTHSPFQLDLGPKAWGTNHFLQAVAVEDVQSNLNCFVQKWLISHLANSLPVPRRPCWTCSRLSVSTGSTSI